MVQAQRRIHFTMAFIGGFLGVYTILRFAGLFGSAQTANLIYLATDLLGGSWTDMLLRLGGAALYMAGIALTVWLPLGPVRDLRRLSVGIDMAAAILVAASRRTLPGAGPLSAVFCHGLSVEQLSRRGRPRQLQHFFHQQSPPVHHGAGQRSRRNRPAPQGGLLRQDAFELSLRCGHKLPVLEGTGASQRTAGPGSLCPCHGAAVPGTPSSRFCKIKKPPDGGFFYSSFRLPRTGGSAWGFPAWWALVWTLMYCAFSLE